MKKSIASTLAAVVSAILWATSFAVAFSLSKRQFLPALMWIELTMLLWSLSAYVRNYFSPIYGSPLIDVPVSLGYAGLAILLDIIVFQLCCFHVFTDIDGFRWYYRYILIVQLGNLFLLWILVCAAIGQRNFHPFFVDFMSRPFHALAALLSGRYGERQP